MAKYSNRTQFQKSNTRVKFRFYTLGDSSYDSSEDLVLPVDTVEIMPIPYVPEGGTVLELYDKRRKFRKPQYGFRMNVEYAHERSDFATVGGNLGDLINVFATTANDVCDCFVYYRRSDSTYVNQDDVPCSASDGSLNGNALNDYKIGGLIPRIEEESISVMFENQARMKENNLELVSTHNGASFSEIKWISE